jgi:SOS-response transcriptional repressor LexA
MTPAQLRILQAIRTLQLDTRCTPSFAQIAEACGLRSLATVHKHIKVLVTRGYLVRQQQRTRSLALTALGLNTLLGGKTENGKTYHAALQRIGHALGLPAGTDLLGGDPERKIAKLMEDIKSLERW